MLQEQKLVVTAQSEQEGAILEAAEIVNQYARTLPHIPFQAVGNNFKGVVEVEDANKVLLELAGGNFDFDAPAYVVGFQVVYHDVNNSLRTISINAGSGFKQKAQDQEPIRVELLLFDANYHRDASSAPAVEKAIACALDDLRDYKNYLEMFQRRVSR